MSIRILYCNAAYLDLGIDCYYHRSFSIHDTLAYTLNLATYSLAAPDPMQIKSNVPTLQAMITEHRNTVTSTFPHSDSMSFKPPSAGLQFRTSLGERACTHGPRCTHNHPNASMHRTSTEDGASSWKSPRACNGRDNIVLVGPFDKQYGSYKWH